VFLLITAVGVGVAIRGRPSLVLLVYFSIYILLGLAEEVLFGRRRRAAARATAALPPRGCPSRTSRCSRRRKTRSRWKELPPPPR